MPKRYISEADGLRYLGGIALALVVFLSIYFTERWDEKAVMRAALFYPPTMLLTAALFAPRRLSYVLRGFTALFCGAMICGALIVVVLGIRQGIDWDSGLKFIKLGLWLPIFTAGFWWAITGRIAPWRNKKPETESPSIDS